MASERFDLPSTVEVLELSDDSPSGSRREGARWSPVTLGGRRDKKGDNSK